MESNRISVPNFTSDAACQTNGGTRRNPSDWYSGRYLTGSTGYH